MKALLAILIPTLTLSACFSNTVFKGETHLQNELNFIRDQFKFPGISAYYIFNDGRSGGAYSGFANLDTNLPLSESPRMLGASTGKSFVGALTISLALEGHLNLDELISSRLSKYEWFERLPNHKVITVRHLLTHSAGIADHVHDEEFQKSFKQSLEKKENPFTAKKLINYILDKPPLFPPGKNWSYSDTGYILIGILLEDVTGKEYYQLINERFIEPLQLTDTTPATRRRIKNLAVGYINENNAFGLPRKTLDAHGRLYWHPGVEWTGGGLVTSAKDLALWGAALLSGGLVENSYLPLLITGVEISPGNSDILYGAGIVVNRNKKFGTTYGHSGWVPGYISTFRYYESLGLTIAIQINTDDGFKDNDKNILHKIEERLFSVVSITPQKVIKN